MPSTDISTEIANGLNEVLAQHGIDTRITSQDIVVTENTVSDGVLGEKIS